MLLHTIALKSEAYCAQIAKDGGLTGLFDLLTPPAHSGPGAALQVGSKLSLIRAL